MRWAQVWRARMVARPCATRSARSAGSAAKALRCCVISGAVAGDQEVLAGREQALRVVPGRADQRDAAGERLEDADGGDAGQGVDVEAAGDVDGGEVAGEDLRHLGVRQPAPIVRAVAVQHRAGPRRGSARHGRRAEVPPPRPARAGIRSSSSRAFAVAPIADPDQAAIAQPHDRRVKQPDVGRLVPDEDAIAPAPAAVDLRQRLAEGEHAVIAVEVEVRGWPRDR